MPSTSHQLVVGLLRATRVNRPFVDADRAREHLRRSTLRPAAYGPPRRLRRDVQVSVDHRDGWPVYTVAPRDGRAAGGVVYVHGGGWVNQVAPQHWHLVALLAARARTTVTVPIYPLVPHGTAAEVVPRVARLVRDSTAAHGPTCLAGDSAGGQVALSAALLLRDEQLRVPLTALVAPALDLSLANPGIDEVQPSDPWLGREGTRVFIEHWRGGLPLDDPRVSPLAGDLAGLGPLLVMSGTRDIVTPDTRLLVRRARDAGVAVEHHEGQGLVHVYPLLPVPEGRAARAVLVRRVAAATGAGHTRSSAALADSSGTGADGS